MTPVPASAAADTEITVSEAVTFPDGIPGFESCRQLGRHGGRRGHAAAPAARDRRRRRVVPGHRSARGARAAIGAISARRIAAASAPTDDEPLLWLAIVMMEPSGALTVNLRAPIVINPRTMTGQQVLPHNCLYPLRHVLVDAE